MNLKDLPLLAVERQMDSASREDFTAPKPPESRRSARSDALTSRVATPRSIAAGRMLDSGTGPSGNSRPIRVIGKNYSRLAHVWRMVGAVVS